MLHYILQVVAFQVLFLAVYDLFLRHQTFFLWNRIYLLVSSCLTLGLPFIKIGFLSDFGSEIGVITLPEVVLGSSEVLSPMSRAAMEVAGTTAEPVTTPFWQWVLLGGSLVFLLILLIRALQLALIASKSPRRWQNNILLIELVNSYQAYSFFNSIFLGSNISNEDQEVILKHEMVHVRHGHSLDVMWFQLLRVSMWFNPAVYWYYNRIVELHEYTADNKVIASTQKQSYYENLLKQAFRVQSLALTNAFFSKSLLKKRLQMMQQGQSKTMNYWRYALIIPLVLGMLTYVGCEKEAFDDNFTDSLNLEQYTHSYNYSGLSDGLPAHVESKRREIDLFLMENPDYVSWIEMDFTTKTMSESVHHKDEIPSFDYQTIEGKLPDGTTRSSLFNMDLVKEYGKKEGQRISSKDFAESESIPYAVVDQVPTFESCADLTGAERKKCTSMEVAKFVNGNFNTDLALSLGLEGRQRIAVFFKIDTNGDVIGVGARAPHKALEEEAKRVITALPKFIPGVHNGETVVVPYSLPILFQIQE